MLSWFPCRVLTCNICTVLADVKWVEECTRGDYWSYAVTAVYIQIPFDPNSLHARLQIPKALLLDYSVFLFAGFCLLLCGGFRHIVCRTTKTAWDWLILPQVFGKHGEKGMSAAPLPARGAPAVWAAGSGPRPQLRGCRSQPRAGGEGLGAFPSPYQDSRVSTVDTLLPGLTWKLPLQKPQI